MPRGPDQRRTALCLTENAVAPRSRGRSWRRGPVGRESTIARSHRSYFPCAAGTAQGRARGSLLISTLPFFFIDMKESPMQGRLRWVRNGGRARLSRRRSTIPATLVLVRRAAGQSVVLRAATEFRLSSTARLGLAVGHCCGACPWRAAAHSSIPVCRR